MIRYLNCLDHITEDQLLGFFVDWPHPPSKEKHYELLKKSSYICLAFDDELEMVVGFITAISDEVLSAYIPLLEVLPSHKGKGIGKQLLGYMLKTLKNYYMVDLMCDPDMQAYYQQFDMVKSKGMILRNYNKQNGRQ